LDDQIRIRGARQHNLNGVDVDIPRWRLTAVSGVSGSGKSSLVFDTLYAEGQRSYVESLSTYARQFLERMPKPDVDWIDGISPAIAIQQRNAARSGRSTVGTVTEINDYLRVLFARVGRIICPDCEIEVKPETPATVWRATRKTFTESDPVMIGYPQTIGGDDWQETLMNQGFQRVERGGRILRLDDDSVAGTGIKPGDQLVVIVDRIKLVSRSKSRFAEAVELAFQQSGGTALVLSADADTRQEYHSHRICNGCNMHFPAPTPHLFSFNSPQGACPECNGFGNKLEFSEDLIIPDVNRTLMDGAVKPWSTSSFTRQHTALIRFCQKNDIPVKVPWKSLKPKMRKQVMETRSKAFVGVLPFLEDMRQDMKQGHHRFFTRRFMGDTHCRACGGSRLCREALAVKVGKLDMGVISRLTLDDAHAKIKSLRLAKDDRLAVSDVLDEILNRLDFLQRVGLGYLTLDRLSRTLSGGEAQRIHLANALGSRLVDTLYILDEPTTGLHAADVEKLIGTLKDLVEVGNTVVVVEHDLQVLKAADHFVELGPGAGTHGGDVVYQGPLDTLMSEGSTLTSDYMKGIRTLHPRQALPVDGVHYLTIKGARKHNLRDIDIKIPTGRLVCLTGVSGSGKSTLMNDCLHDGLTRKVQGGTGRAFPFTGFQGADWVDKVILVDQAPIGKSSRSNPATYLQILSLIRDLFAATLEAKARGFAPGRFSFNTAGGRCVECQGLGEHRVEMHFMADISVPCEVCGGSRFNPATLEIKYRGLNIAQVLEMTIEEALEFFKGQSAVRDRLLILRKVGLQYLTLGQSATTLSGGESQRLKIARELTTPAGKRNLYLLDEPTTGLHIDDVACLVKVLHELVDHGHSVIVIEHNLDFVARADWIIDLGPGGGDAGGRVVAAGRPADVAKVEESLTGRYLADLLRQQATQS
jgi:excinuclease ABC subunit A